MSRARNKQAESAMNKAFRRLYTCSVYKIDISDLNTEFGCVHTCSVHTQGGWVEGKKQANARGERWLHVASTKQRNKRYVENEGKYRQVL